MPYPRGRMAYQDMNMNKLEPSDNEQNVLKYKYCMCLNFTESINLRL
jgi:hypothetical protein